MTSPFTEAHEARVREIVAEMIGQYAAGAGARVAEATEASARALDEIAVTARLGLRQPTEVCR